MLFTPEAHEAVSEEQWSAERMRTAIAAIVADAESAFDDGWPLHPRDDEGDDASVPGLRMVPAGPLRKGANLCHGTAGNGYAFLALLERTGDERWLARARAFAMHAAGQVEQGRSTYGCGRHTLWTGDLGTALYLADCIDGAGEVPLP
jgi:hypothetical protein